MPTGTPNYLVVNPDGTVTAKFTGSVQLTEAGDLSTDPTNALYWVDANDGVTVRETIQGGINPSAPRGHALILGSDSDTSDYAHIILRSLEFPGASKGSSIIFFEVDDAVNNFAISEPIFDSLGRSLFLRGGALDTTAVNARVPALVTPYTPNTNRPTLVAGSIDTQAANGWMRVYFGPTTGTGMVWQDAVSPAGRIVVPFFIFVPSGWSYQFNPVAGSPVIYNSQVYEITL